MEHFAGLIALGAGVLAIFGLNALSVLCQELAGRYARWRRGR